MKHLFSCRSLSLLLTLGLAGLTSSCTSTSQLRSPSVATSLRGPSTVAQTTPTPGFRGLFLTKKSSASRKPQVAPRPNVPPVKVHDMVLARSTRSNTRLIIDIGRQKAFLLVDNKVAIETPISSARAGMHTPRGNFNITERVRSGKISTLYGVGMPCWMRLDGTVFGVHAGYLPGYPASHGCVRLPSDAAAMIFDNTGSGTRVSIVSSWDGAS